ncbi:MAG: SO_0444 family Cu/Zn efflux transporter [Magnetovibrio sp.]|nr:SO_0444 family Cu/Zn efflux transporter [Magnetovibrio sp.]
METFTAILLATWDLYLDAAPWLVFGVVLAGLLHALMPEGMLAKWLGGNGGASVVKAALVGAPLPLCSCGVIPAAIGLRKDGASKGATVSFLISTPETGPDSVAVSYALLGPFMAIMRPVAAIFSAIVSGLMTNVFVAGETDMKPQPEPELSCGSCCSTPKSDKEDKTIWQRSLGGLRYGFSDVLDDFALWLVIGLGLAGIMFVLIEPETLGAYGSGIGAMLIMALVGVPIFVCATASTPIAAGLIAVGVSPGAALVFLLVGPATNIATIGVVARNLGARALMGYLLGIVGSALIVGLATDAALNYWGISVLADMQAVTETVAYELKLGSGLILAPFIVRSLWGEAKRRIG